MIMMMSTPPGFREATNAVLDLRKRLRQKKDLGRTGLRGTNNLAVGMNLYIDSQRAHQLPLRPVHPPAYLFTDSQFSLGIVTDGWRSHTHPEFAMKLKILVRNFPIPMIIIAWVPAPCGIDSNERAGG